MGWQNAGWIDIESSGRLLWKVDKSVSIRCGEFLDSSRIIIIIIIIIIIFCFSMLVNPLKLYVPPGLTFRNSVFYPQCIYVFCVDLRKKTAIISLYNINLSVFIT